MEKGQILEGIVRNVTSVGAFVDLGGIVGLVYVKHMVWDKRIDHPDKVKDADGNLFFQKDKKIKVVVIDFDEEKTRISLSTRELLPNPWEELPPNMVEGAEITGVVSKILDRGVFVKVENLVEAFMYIADLGHSNYISHPTDVVELGQEVKAKILTLDRETQEFRVGIKQLLPEPFGTPEFFAKYALNTRHEGIVRRFTDQGAYIELEPGIEGFLHTRHMSWTKKIKYPGQVLRKKEKQEVLILNVDEEHKILELGLRELEDSPWEKFETIFIPGSTHEGTVIKVLPKGVAGIIQLPYGLECKVDREQLMKEDKTMLAEGEIAKFVILDFLRDKQKVIISHTATFQKTHRGDSVISTRAVHYTPKTTKTTLGDMSVLSQLKEKIEADNKKESKEVKKEIKEIKEVKKAAKKEDK